MAVTTEKTALSTINCSGGKGVIEAKDCLKCALDEDNTCGIDYALLMAIHEDNIRTGIHVSDLLNCSRMAWYNRMRHVPPYPHERLVVTLGTAVHHHLETPEDDPNVFSEKLVEAHGVVGTVDLFYPRTGLLVDLKTTRWITPSRLPYAKHGMQVNVYAYMLKQAGFKVHDLKIQYIDMSGPSKCRPCALPLRQSEGGLISCPVCGNAPKNAHLGALLFPVTMFDDDEVKDFIIERRTILEDALESGNPPEKEESFLCKYCSHADECLNNQTHGDATAW